MSERALTDEDIEDVEQFLREADDRCDELCLREALERVLRYGVPFAIYSAAFATDEDGVRPRAGQAADILYGLVEAIQWGAQNVKQVRSVMQIEDHETERLLAESDERLSRGPEA